MIMTSSSTNASEALAALAEQVKNAKRDFSIIQNSIDVLHKKPEQMIKGKVPRDGRVQELYKELDSQNTKNKSAMEEIDHILKGLWKKSLDEVIGQVEKEVKGQIDAQVEDQVTAYLSPHKSAEKQQVVKDTLTKIEEIKNQLHNSESQRANGLVKSENMNQILNTIKMTNGKVSGHFPRTLNDLFSLDGITLRSLMNDYGLTLEDSASSNRNIFMRFCGVKYYMVAQRID
ncbi:hypothetical protein AX17_004561 [Amanita inopinata Kibby_2008]|nr:hypothetical protein AX17_004561 [Amanita inopinata Kibby_2008]